MTKSDALKEAQRRWGPTAFIVRRRTQNYLYEVGTAPYQVDKQGYSNKSWEDAFDNADARLLHQAVEFAEQVNPLPRCKHGKALRDGSGECLEPKCGCRAVEEGR